MISIGFTSDSLGDNEKGFWFEIVVEELSNYDDGDDDQIVTVDPRSLADISNQACFNKPDDEPWGTNVTGLSGTIGTIHASQLTTYSDTAESTTEYDSNMKCWWNFTIPAGKYLRLTSQQFELENSNICDYDYVVVHLIGNHATDDTCRVNPRWEEISDNNADNPCRHCGWKVESAAADNMAYFPTNNSRDYSVYIASTSGSNVYERVSVYFRSDNSDNKKGFSFDWEIVDADMVDSSQM